MQDQVGLKDSEAVVQDIKAILARGTQRVSIDLSMACHLHNLGKNIWRYWTVFHVTKIFQNFWFSQLFMYIETEMKRKGGIWHSVTTRMI